MFTNGPRFMRTECDGILFRVKPLQQLSLEPPVLRGNSHSVGTKPRSPGQAAVSVSLEKVLLAEIDQRAKALGISRSAYFAQLARADIAERAPLVITERNIPTSSHPARKQRVA
jgi:hypothetical protein